jgi:hypothetical protein
VLLLMMRDRDQPGSGGRSPTIGLADRLDNRIAPDATFSETARLRCFWGESTTRGAVEPVKSWIMGKYFFWFVDLRKLSDASR